MATTAQKSERINLRIQKSAKQLIERAAGFEGKTISHFILASAVERAEKTVQGHEMMTLNAKNSRDFFDALNAPVQFNAQLTSALEAHGRRVVKK